MSSVPTATSKGHRLSGLGDVLAAMRRTRIVADDTGAPPCPSTRRPVPFS